MKVDQKIKGIEILQATYDNIIDIIETQNLAFPDDPYNLNEADFKNAIDSPNQTIWIAIYDGQYAGYVALNNKRFRPWTSLDNLIVIKQYWGKKIGKKLLAHAIKNSTRLLMRLFVEKNNLAAIKLYKTNGFTHIYTKTNHYENNDSALVMIIRTK
ncbi:MAG: GNAT family N-acetyltransferase [OCS116 cluster bacterium]|nr:GNAT family N-acetyltransferase [OCS116 cluster bacterium]